MTQSIQDRLSLVAVYIELFFNETFLAKGSAFLWSKDNKTFLVSNWHNFTGCNPADKKPLSKTAAIPNRVVCSLSRNRLSNGAVINGFIKDNYSYSLLDADAQPLFIEHPFSNHVDIAALEIKLHEYVVPYYLNEQVFDERISIYPGQDVFIIGYPLGVLNDKTLPIWKRGTIASEPYVLIDGLKKIFIDTASRKGMSGSFVVAQHTGIFSPTGELNEESWIGSDRKILGIYSGRIGASESEAQLGIVWHKDLIEEVISGKIFHAS